MGRPEAKMNQSPSTRERHGKQTFVCLNPRRTITIMQAMAEELVELPEDVIYSIFLHLPSKSLLRFCSVSKRWNQAITSNTFSADRLNKASVIVMTVPNFRSNYHHLRLHRLGPLTFPLTSDKDYSPTVRIPFPLTRSPNRFWISSCGTDGLLCVVSSRGNTTAIAVWNPCTNRHRTVLWHRGRAWDCRKGSIAFVGFGYDARVCDYKVVVVYNAFKKSYGRCRVAFTALKSGVWREVDDARSSHLLGNNKFLPYRVGDPPLLLIQQFEATAVGDDVHWLCNKTEDNSLALLSFNLTEEKLTLTVPLPIVEINYRIIREGSMMWTLDQQLGVSDGCLRLCCLDRERKLIDVRKHWKQENKWERVYTIPCFFTIHYNRWSFGLVSEGMLVVKGNNGVLASYTSQGELAFTQKGQGECIHYLETESLIIP